jgi:hypothetical protein
MTPGRAKKSKSRPDMIPPAIWGGLPGGVAGSGLRLVRLAVHEAQEVLAGLL